MVECVLVVRLHSKGVLGLFEHFHHLRRVVFQRLQVLRLVLVCQVDLRHMDLEFLQNVPQLRGIIAGLGEPNQVVVEDFSVLVDAFSSVPIGVDGDKNGF